MNDKDLRKLLETVAAIFQDWVEIEMARVGLLRSEIIKQVRTEVSVSAMTVSLTIPQYHVYIEGGRRPGKRPPFAVILKWVIRKFGSKDANRRAHAICGAIAKRGIPARPFMQRAIEHALSEAADTVPVQLKVTVDEELRKILYK